MMIVYASSSFYARGYFEAEIREGRFPLPLARRFGALWWGALAAMTLTLISNNLGIMWVGIEATTLMTAFLICIHVTPASLEAMWKYLLICSVGVAFAFLGTLLVAASARGVPLPSTDVLLWTTLRDIAPRLDPTMLKAGFLFLLVGYGTKAGLAPMHSWLPDAHSQAPAPVSALFSGFLLNAALYCLMRYVPILDGGAGLGGWCQKYLVLLGSLSILVAAVFILFQRDVKRLLAYSSVEHMGLIVLGVGLGGAGVFAALFHAFNHSLGKSLAFFSAGRLGKIYGTHEMSRMVRVVRASPSWGLGLVGSLMALIGVAPFSVFLSEFLLMKAAVDMQSYGILGVFLAGCGIVFVGALRHAVGMAWGGDAPRAVAPKGSAMEAAIVFGLLACLLVLGLWMPDGFREVLIRAARVVGGGRP
jgi:hydrogenase-4 component F